jgi:hypothetical protein
MGAGGDADGDRLGHGRGGGDETENGGGATKRLQKT